MGAEQGVAALSSLGYVPSFPLGSQMLPFKYSALWMGLKRLSLFSDRVTDGECQKSRLAADVLSILTSSNACKNREPRIKTIP